MILDIQLERIHPCINPILSTKKRIKCGNECGTECGIKFFSVVFSTVRDLVSGVLILPFSFPSVLEVESAAMSYASRKLQILQPQLD